MRPISGRRITKAVVSGKEVGREIDETHIRMNMNSHTRTQVLA